MGAVRRKSKGDPGRGGRIGLRIGAAGAIMEKNEERRKGICSLK